MMINEENSEDQLKQHLSSSRCRLFCQLPCNRTRTNNPKLIKFKQHSTKQEGKYPLLCKSYELNTTYCNKLAKE